MLEDSDNPDRIFKAIDWLMPGVESFRQSTRASRDRIIVFEIRQLARVLWYHRGRPVFSLRFPPLPIETRRVRTSWRGLTSFSTLDSLLGFPRNVRSYKAFESSRRE